ncbi:MAG TPA: hypothetical protein DCF91_01570 [Porphyromonadaceae bacterium]|nr:hypothetical protein [Porphyromonadaceae bacterium]
MKWQRKKNSKRNRIQYRSAKKNKESLKTYKKTSKKLRKLIENSKLKRKVEALAFLDILDACCEVLIGQVLHDSIKVKDPLALMAGLKQMQRDNYLSFKSSEMGRILIQSCVFNSEIVVNLRMLSAFFNEK